MFMCDGIYREARESVLFDREAGVTARERRCREQEADMHARWANLAAERKNVETQRSEVGNSMCVYVSRERAHRK